MEQTTALRSSEFGSTWEGGGGNSFFYGVVLLLVFDNG